MNTLIVIEEADKELKEAAVWYEEKSPGLGMRFIAVISQKSETILEHERNNRRKGNFREAVVKIFPYVIVYTHYKKEGVIVVSSFFHTRQAEIQKRSRIENRDQLDSLYQAPNFAFKNSAVYPFPFFTISSGVPSNTR